MIKITKPINVSLLLEELEDIGAVKIVDGERHTDMVVTKTDDGYTLMNEPIGAELVVMAHDPQKKSKREKDKETRDKDKKNKRDKILNKLGLTEQELRDLLD